VAENTGGVNKVVDHLRVYPPEKARSKGGVIRKTGRFVTDTWITAKIKTTLLFNKEARDADIKVDTSEGVVTLSGTVKSQTQMIRLIRLVCDVTGVKRVESLLKIKRGAS
jgi:osmotically-inducible protein OsmY